jgi:tripartite-type tricarboxylate transporter receptor subunit TctC
MEKIVKCLVATMIAALPLCAVGQEYPARSVRIITPYAAGGSADALSRIAAQQLGNRWKQPVVVDNRPGASGNIGVEIAAKTPPDGYSLVVIGAPHAINMALFTKLPFNLERDFSHISVIASFPAIIVVHPSLPVKSVRELIALAKSRPDELNFASPNNGSPNHLVIELIKSMGKVRMTHIPYKGGSGGQMLSDMISGQIQLGSLGLPPAVPFIKSGKLRPLAVTSNSRSALLPEVPTVAESGLAGFDIASWYGLAGPAGLPAAIAKKINADLIDSLSSTEARQRLAALGAEPVPMSTEEFSRYVRDEVAKWGTLVKVSGAKLE